MNCSEARKCIRQGITPGSTPAIRAELGFHLVHCPDCSAYYKQNATLLNNLLLPSNHAYTQPAVAISSSPAPGRPPQTRRFASATHRPDSTDSRSRRKTPVGLGGWLWRISVTLLVLFPVVGLLWLAVVVIRAEQNIAAMIVTPVPATSQTVAPLGQPAEERSGQPNVEALIDSALPATPEPAAPAFASGIASALPSETAATPWPTIQVLSSPVPSPTPDLPTPPPGEVLNILLLGQDRRPDETDIPRTDAIMLVRVDPDSHRVALLSLPRDLWVTIPGYGFDRINMAYRSGELYGALGGGIGLAARTVSGLLNIRVDYVILVDFEGMIGLIDTLGGITVNVEAELYDPNFPTMDYGYTVAHFLPGSQPMDGLTALTYSRIRHPDSDFMRIRRQQAVLIAIGARLRERGDLQNLFTIDQITESLRDYIRTDMPQERMVSLLWNFRNYDIAHVEQYSVSGDMVTTGIGTDLYALVPSYEALAHLTNLFIGTP